MLIGCIFCHHVHAVKGTLNTHLNLYVPEMALARGVPHEEDAQHHVGMIRELRWGVRNRLEPSIEWDVSPDDEERAVLQAYSTLIYHPVDKYVSSPSVLWLMNQANAPDTGTRRLPLPQPPQGDHRLLELRDPCHARRVPCAATPFPPRLP